MRKHNPTQNGDPTFLNSMALALIPDSLRVQKTHVMCLSSGAVAAVNLAPAHPRRVDKLIPAAPGLIGYEWNHDPALAANQLKENAAKQEGDTLNYMNTSCAPGQMAPTVHPVMPACHCDLR